MRTVIDDFDPLLNSRSDQQLHAYDDIFLSDDFIARAKKECKTDALIYPSTESSSNSSNISHYSVLRSDHTLAFTVHSNGAVTYYQQPSTICECTNFFKYTLKDLKKETGKKTKKFDKNKEKQQSNGPKRNKNYY